MPESSFPHDLSGDGERRQAQPASGSNGRMDPVRPPSGGAYANQTYGRSAAARRRPADADGPGGPLAPRPAAARDGARRPDAPGHLRSPGLERSAPDDEPAEDRDDDADDADALDALGGSGRRGLLRRRRKDKAPRSLRRTIVEWVGVIGGGIVIALVIEAFLVQAFWIPTPSMVPTLQVGDRVLVNKLSYRLHDVHRGDVIVFERPPTPAGEGADDGIKDLIKRVIAVGGDTIEARNGLVYVNGERVDEDYLEPGIPTDNLPRQTVPADHVFVMGDNRTNSEDSRVFGPISEDDIVGRAFLRVLPVDDIGGL